MIHTVLDNVTYVLEGRCCIKAVAPISKPRDDSFCVAINIGHEPDLMIALQVRSLIDAYRIDPEPTTRVFVSDEMQGVVQIMAHSEESIVR
jgi:hypothetical protein